MSATTTNNAANAELARRWFEEVWNERRSETVEELLTPESIGHTDSGEMVGSVPFLEHIYQPFLAAFPDLNLRVEDTISEGDRVAVRWSATGTHTGQAMGLQPTQRSIDIRGITWMVFRDGKMVECWDSWNIGGLIQRLTAP